MNSYHLLSVPYKFITVISSLQILLIGLMYGFIKFRVKVYKFLGSISLTALLLAVIWWLNMKKHLWG